MAKVRRRPDWPLWAVAIVSAWLALVAGAVLLIRYTGTAVELCIFRRLTGLPCPTCGATRGVLELLAARPVSAWLHNPLLFTVLGLWMVLVGVRILTGRSPRLNLTRPQKALAWAAVAAAVAANWLYLILHVG